MCINLQQVMQRLLKTQYPVCEILCPLKIHEKMNICITGVTNNGNFKVVEHVLFSSQREHLLYVAECHKSFDLL